MLQSTGPIHGAHDWAKAKGSTGPNLNTQKLNIIPWARSALDLEIMAGSDNLPDLLGLYLASSQIEGKSKGTLDSYKRRAGSFIQFLTQGQMPLQASKLRPPHVKLYFLMLFNKGLDHSTINVHYRVLQTFFSWLKTNGFISIDLLEKQKPPKIPRKVVRPFSIEDLQNILKLCSSDTFTGIRNRAIVLLFLDTGLRLAELAAIQLADMNMQQETIRVMGKGAKERVVRMGQETQKALFRYLLQRKDINMCLWVTEEMKPLHKASIQGLIRKLCYRAGIGGVRHGPHTFRHTFATRALMNGAGEFEVQSLLGHSTLQMTRRYAASLGSEHAIAAHRKFSPVDNLKF